MPQSPIRKLVPYAEQAYKEGKTVYHLNIGQPDIKTPQVALDAVKVHSLDILAYTRSEGSEGYRKKIADYYAKNDIHVKHDDIIVTTGGSEALLFAFGSIMDVDDEVIIPEPFYANYNGFSTASGVVVIDKNGEYSVHIVGDVEVASLDNLLKSAGGTSGGQTTSQMGAERQLTVPGISQQLTSGQARSLWAKLYSKDPSFAAWANTKHSNNELLARRFAPCNPV